MEEKTLEEKDRKAEKEMVVIGLVSVVIGAVLYFREHETALSVCFALAGALAILFRKK